MAFQDYSTTPASNGTIAGFNIAENCPPGNLNNVMRQFAADGRALYNQVIAINLATYAPLNAPVFTGQPTYTGRGAFLYHDSSANASGRIYVQAASAPVPAMANGDILLTYA